MAVTVITVVPAVMVVAAMVMAVPPAPRLAPVETVCFRAENAASVPTMIFVDRQ
jgi:hypothetical protein